MTRRPSWAPANLDVDLSRPTPFPDLFQATDAYLDATRHKLAINTYKGAKRTLGLFARVFPDLPPMEVRRQHVQAYADAAGDKCKWLQETAPPRCLRKCKTCPILEGNDPNTCPKYEPLLKSSIGTYLNHLSAFFQWLDATGHYTGANPVAPVQRELARAAQAEQERMDKTPSFVLTASHVRSLVLGCPVHRATMYAYMAKDYLRIHEMAKLRYPDGFDLPSGRFWIPYDRERGNKRRGTKECIIDTELLELTYSHLEWRHDYIKRDANGQPLHNFFFTNHRGHPWPANSKRLDQSVNERLRADCIRLGIIDSNEKPPKSHAFRAFASTWSRDLGIPDQHLKDIRGDVGDKTLAAYDKGREARLQRLYEQYAPKLGI